jgi:hypothetical protein
VIVGWEKTAVLLRLPGGGWELAAECPAETLNRFDQPDWVGEEHTTAGVLALKRWLDRLEPVLGDALAAAVLRAQRATAAPVLFWQRAAWRITRWRCSRRTGPR